VSYSPNATVHAAIVRVVFSLEDRDRLRDEMVARAAATLASTVRR